MTQPHDHNFKWIKNVTDVTVWRNERTTRLHGLYRCACGVTTLGDHSAEGEALLGKTRVLSARPPFDAFIVEVQETVHV